MDEYYDKEKFTGGQQPPQRPPQHPPQKKQDNSGWYSWPVIIVLFALGIWPVALFLMFLNIFGDEKRKKTPPSQRKPSVEARMEETVESAVERAMAKARAAQESGGGKAKAAAQTGSTAAKQAPAGGQNVSKAPAKKKEHLLVFFSFWIV